jgi:membrane-bound lytic murein transglycosylase A
MKLQLVLILTGLLFWGCARAPVKDRSEAMRKAAAPPAVSDDLDFESLISGIKSNADFLEKSSRGGPDLTFGPVKIEKKKYVSALRFLCNNAGDKESFYSTVNNYFDFYEVYGNEDWSQIKATSYYSPVLKGSKNKTKKYSQPLYYTPKDILMIDVDAFIEAFPKWRIFKDQILEQRSTRSLIKARLITNKNGPSTIVPYYTREEIDEDGALKKDKELVIAYVDPVDSFFLQIQGSGIIEMKDGSRFTVGYANQNGHPYVAIGSSLKDKIPLEKMSMQTLQSYLRSLPKREMQKILNRNPSYVFFQKIDSRPLAFLGTEVVDGRTVATDNSLFPKGSLAFLEYEKPIFQNLQATEPVDWVKSARFVLDQDTGGAIRGPGRLDLYAGGGPVAEQFAGVMKNPARLFYLVPKPELLKKLE